MTKRFLISILALIPFAVLFQNCSSPQSSIGEPSPNKSENNLGYYMGFTTWPYSASVAAVDDVYSKLATDGDLVTQHLEGGVPWADAASDVLSEPFSAHYNSHMVGEWNWKSAKAIAGHKMYLAVTPLNTSRSGIADSWTAAGNNITVAPWSGYALDSTQVKSAYLNFCRRAIQFFNPDYFAFGIEVNLLEQNSPTQWQAYLNLQGYIYTQLKSLYPNLPIFVTQTAVDVLGSDYVDKPTSQAAFDAVMASSDYFAISVYPYLSKYLTTQIPGDFFDRLVAKTTKPVVISEGGYLAQTVTLSGGLTFSTDTTKQDNYIKMLLAAADKYSFKFVNQWLVRDFDNSWGTADVIRIFQYDGMYDLSGNPRPALTTWKNKLAIPKH
jgi:hypothetical protein